MTSSIAPGPGAPIGVFDSGMGGLTVLRALQRQLPGRQFLYLGDTARLPYGTKSPETVAHYALQAARVLIDRGVGSLVVACNTASAVALPVLERAFRGVPVFGVVEPGADAAGRQSVTGRVLVLATESTVAGGAYVRAILARRPQAHVWSRPAPLLVALAEEGRTNDALARLALTEYLAGLGAQADTLLLGCTHFPVFRTALEELFPGTVVDSAETTAERVAKALGSGSAGGFGEPRRPQLLATDGVARFRRVGPVFFGGPLGPVDLVDL